MSQLPGEIELKIVIFDDDTGRTKFIRAALNVVPGVENVELVARREEILEAFESRAANAFLLNIFWIGVDRGLDLIETVRSSFPYVPICLLGTREQLITFPGISDYWKRRFRHYYKLPKDSPDGLIIRGLPNLAIQLAEYILANIAKAGLKDLREKIKASGTSLDDNKKGVSTAKPVSNERVDVVFSIVEKALNELDKKSEIGFIVPGFGAEDIQRLGSETIEKASRSLESTATINKYILILGASVILISLIVALTTSSWEAVAFGGFGIAGIIASLITNPLKTIGKVSKQLVQVQVAYLGFLNQLAIINSMQNKHEPNLIEISKRLSEATKDIMETIEACFG